MEHAYADVVGMGVVCPIGLNIHDMWHNLLNGVTGAHRNTFHTFSNGCNLVIPGLEDIVTAEIKNFNPLDWMDKKTIRREPPFCWFALAAAKQAMRQSNIIINDTMRERIAVLIGSGIGGMTAFEQEHRVLIEQGADRVSPFVVTNMMGNAATSLVTRFFGCHGPGLTPVSACATGADSIGEAFRLIQRGDVDVAITGGTEAVITPLALAGFNNMRALAKSHDHNPESRSRPFDRDREGFVMGEGAGIVILASPLFTALHDLKSLGRIAGYARTQDAYHITAPHQEGMYAAQAMRLALQDARIGIDEVVYINPHGTGTPSGDPPEICAIRNVFGERAKKIPISSSKSMIGHMIGAAGAVEVIISLLTLLHGQAHPAVNLDIVDGECTGVYHILKKQCIIPSGAVLSNSFGFGGLNSALVILPST